MAEKIEHSQKERLEQLERLVDKYAQTRVLPLSIPLAIMIFNVVVLLAAGKVAELLIFHVQISEYWFEVIVVGVVVWVILLCPWVTGRLMAGYGDWPYKKEGIIELEEERVPIWAWGAFLITSVGPTLLSLFEIMPARWALALALTSLGTCMLYVGKKQKAEALGLVYGGLCLAEAGLTAIGVHIRFAGIHHWLYSYLLPLMIYVVADGLISVPAVHIYNRRILREIKEMRLFGKHQASKSDS